VNILSTEKGKEGRPEDPHEQRGKEERNIKEYKRGKGSWPAPARFPVSPNHFNYRREGKPRTKAERRESKDYQTIEFTRLRRAKRTH